MTLEELKNTIENFTNWNFNPNMEVYIESEKTSKVWNACISKNENGEEILLIQGSKHLLS